MNTKYLMNFLKLLEYKTFNKTADKLFISQSGLRANISELENELGAPLVKRTKYGCVPTELGLMVAQEAPIVLSYIDKWTKYAVSEDKGKNTLLISSTKIFCDTIGVPTISKFCRKYPDVSINAESADATLIKLKNNECNIAVIHAYVDDYENLKKDLPSALWTISNLSECSFNAVINKNNPLFGKTIIRKEDFIELSFVTSTTWEMYNKDKHYNVRHGFTSKTMPLYVDSQKNIFKIINDSSNYYAIMSEFMRYSDSYEIYDNIRFMPLNNSMPLSAYYLIHKKSSMLTSIELAFIAELKDSVNTLF